MKVEIVGGGPAGLYLAILLKKAERTIDVRVLERNAPDATFGWGVVFSEETLGALRDADPESHLEITDTFARWDRVEIRYRERVLSSRGHSSRSRRTPRPTSSSAQTARTASSGGSATSGRPSSPRAASTSGSAPTSSSTPSPSSSRRRSTGSTTCTLIPTTSA
jgi:hypothetical protein